MGGTLGLSQLRSIVFVGLLVGVGFVVGRVRADGAPTTQPLFYAGTVEEGGALTDGVVPIGLALFSAAVAGDRLCDVPSANLDVVRGRFGVDASACRDAVEDNADVFVEVTVRGVPLPRQRIGAVPYALEADRAQVAAVAEAVAGGAVDAAAIAAGAVGNSEVANDAVSLEKLDAATRQRLSDFGVPLRVFLKGGNNGTNSCNQFCPSAFSEPRGFCVGGKILAASPGLPRNGEVLNCDANAGGQLPGSDQIVCFCAAPEF